MERLTRKSLEYKDTWIVDGSLSNIEGVVRGNAIDRLAELEDVLEKYGIENLDDFIKEYSSRNIKLANDNYVLEQQLAELKAENERLQQEYGEMYEDIYDRVSEEFKLNNGYEYQINSAMNEIEKLQQQLKGKDKRIENLKQANESFTYFIEKIITYYGKSDICYKDVDSFLSDIVKDNTKQVCEKIEKAFTEYLPLKDKTGAGFYARLNAILKKYGVEDE